jgi:hypothetical protein
MVIDDSANAMQSNQASGDGSSNAPDDEIRQLVHAQRARAIATSRTQSSGVAGPRGGAIDLEGVTLEEVLGQGSFGVVSMRCKVPVFSSRGANLSCSRVVRCCLLGQGSFGVLSRRVSPQSWGPDFL